MKTNTKVGYIQSFNVNKEQRKILLWLSMTIKKAIADSRRSKS